MAILTEPEDSTNISNSMEEHSTPDWLRDTTLSSVKKRVVFTTAAGSRQEFHSLVLCEMYA